MSNEFKSPVPMDSQEDVTQYGAMFRGAGDTGSMSTFRDAPSYSAPEPIDFSRKTPTFQESMPSLGASAFEPVPSPGATTGDATKSLLAAGVSKLAGVAPVISAITGAGALIMNWWSAGKQMEESRRARQQEQQAYAEQMTESRRRYDLESARQERELQYQQQAALSERGLATRREEHLEKMDEAKLQADREQKTWDRYLTLMTNMTNMMSSPQSRAGFAQLYKR